MSREVKSRLLILSIGSLAFIWLGPKAAQAATISYKGVSLTPAIEQLVVNPDQTSLNYQVRLDNNQNTPLTLQVSTLDFKSLNDSGGLAFITSNVSSLKDKHGLANWISVQANTITLPPEAGQTVTVTIDNRSDLSPGGHYAAVLFKVVSPTGFSGANNADIDQVISSLIFLRKTSGETYSLSLVKKQLVRNHFGWPTKADLYFKNDGNTQTAPRGTIKLGGTSFILNQDSNLTLPDSTRLYETDLAAAKPGLLPGFRHIAISYRPDADGQTKSADISFFYVRPWHIAVLVITIAILASVSRRVRLILRWSAKVVTWTLGLLWRFIKALVRLFKRKLGLQESKKKVLKKPLKKQTLSTASDIHDGGTLLWIGLKADRQLRRLEILTVKSAKIGRRVLRWTGLKADRQLRRLEIWATKAIKNKK